MFHYRMRIFCNTTPLNPLPVAKVFERLQIDLIGHLPKTMLHCFLPLLYLREDFQLPFECYLYTHKPSFLFFASNFSIYP